MEVNGKGILGQLPVSSLGNRAGVGTGGRAALSMGKMALVLTSAGGMFNWRSKTEMWVRSVTHLGHRDSRVVTQRHWFPGRACRGREEMTHVVTRRHI